MARYLTIFITLVLLWSCSSEKNDKDNIYPLAKHFFDTYSDRSDWEHFKQLYADDLVFEDVIFRYRFDRTGFENFYNWPDTLFQKHPEYPETLILENLTINDSTAIGSGYFTPFYYGEKLFGIDHQWRFVIELTFDKQGLVKHQKDFIEYPPEYLKSAAEALLKVEN
ncbi:hypothetical protein [Roseivirga sp.]|uniref:hypothetical protein n=1 Tax=Roseivirga sp. TaxID=1964215 RepID=UPI003B52B583